MLVASQGKILDREAYDNATSFDINAPDPVTTLNNPPVTIAA